jgi:hypothetical protein
MMHFLLCGKQDLEREKKWAFKPKNRLNNHKIKYIANAQLNAHKCPNAH